MFRFWKYIVIIILLIGGALALWLIFSRSKDPEEGVTVERSRVVDIRTVARLCSMEIYREVAIHDTINDKEIIGVQRQRGSITFDLEELPETIALSMSADPSKAPDTIRLRLPKEKVEILESTEPGSWRVIDTRNLRLIGSDVMTPAEENRAKQRAIDRTRSRLYRDGTVSRGRREAATALSRYLETLTGAPVVIEP